MKYITDTDDLREETIRNDRKAKINRKDPYKVSAMQKNNSGLLGTVNFFYKMLKI